MKITFTFADPISEVYRKKLQTFSDSLLAQGNSENRPPIFFFSGMNRQRFIESKNIQKTAYGDSYIFI